MKKTFNIIFVLLAVLLLTSCDAVNNFLPNWDVIGMVYGQSPRNDNRFEQSMQYNEEHLAQYADIVLTKDDYKVYFGTDMHVDSTWRNTTKFAQAAQADTECPFAIVLGDVINAMDNYPNFLAGMAPLSKRWFCTAGNHDIYYGQWKEYLQYIGSSVYSFQVITPSAKDLYICLDSSDGTLARKQFAWLKETLESAQEKSYRHIIVFTHTHMFKHDSTQGHISNYVLEETYAITDLLGKYGVDWYVSGHAHSRNITDFKGVKYIIVDTLQDPVEEAAFMVATVGRQLQYEYINIKDL